MNYFFYSIVFFAVIGLIFVPLLFKRRLQLDFFTKRALKESAADNPLFFSSFVMRAAVKTALRHRCHSALDLLYQGHLVKAANKLLAYDEQTALLLKAFYHPQTAVRYLQRNLRKNPRDTVTAVWLALLLQAQKSPLAPAAWESVVSEKKLPIYLKANYLSHLAELALKNGDLKFASSRFYQAARLFGRSRALYEEAYIYLRLGTIYRVSFIDDVAETLFLSALKIFRFLDFQKGIAQAFAHLGMLMTGEERFNEAEDYFFKAQKIYESSHSVLPLAETENQLALLYLLQKDYKKSKKLLQQAKKKHLLLNNLEGIAFSADLAANLFWKQDKLTQAIKSAASAARLYRQNDNVSGFLDSLYLQAQALFKRGDDDEAESVLRQILTVGKQDSGCFYLANAYNLLGIIYVKRRDLSRAKGLFKQSLDLEQRGVRCNALAVDYANIGLIELRRGQKESARKNFQTALTLAHQAEDEFLEKQIRKHLSDFNN